MIKGLNDLVLITSKFERCLQREYNNNIVELDQKVLNDYKPNRGQYLISLIDCNYFWKDFSCAMWECF